MASIKITARQETAILSAIAGDAPESLTLDHVIDWVHAGMPDPNSLRNRVARFLGKADGSELPYGPVALPVDFVDTDHELGALIGTDSEGNVHRVSLETEALKAWKETQKDITGRGRWLTIERAWKYAQSFCELPEGFEPSRIVLESLSADIVAGSLVKSGSGKNSAELAALKAENERKNAELEEMRKQLEEMRAIKAEMEAMREMMGK